MALLMLRRAGIYSGFLMSLLAKEMSPIFQWDGGGDYSIHGRSARRLPDIDLGVLFYKSEWGMPRMRIELLADGGYRRNLEVTVRFRDDEHRHPYPASTA